MNRFRAALIVAVLVAASLTLSGPAEAGGPTSALLSVPGSGKTASLYYTDPEYDALADLVGFESAIGKVDTSGQDHSSGPGITVTWLIHDVMPWRVDHIYLTGEGAPWIATQVSNGEETLWDETVVWHQPTSPGELEALLDKLGVGAASRAAGDFNGVAGAQAPATADSAPDSAPAPEQPAAAEESSFAGIWWGLAGLVVGILLTAFWARRTRGASDPPTEPADETYAPESELVAAETLDFGRA